MKCKLLIATHKPYHFPDDRMYQPIQVGVALNTAEFGYLCDNDGENISNKNNSFCELTALYWAWKNRYADDVVYIGLVHYRRYFSGESKFGDMGILSEDKILNLLSSYDVILPQKRNYYIETVQSHYRHAHYKRDLDILEKVLQEYSPEYMDTFVKVMEQKSLYLYNMFVMKTEYFYEYCEWLFMILFEVEKRIDISHYDMYQSRVFGFLAERLLNVWLLHNELMVKEVKVQNIEGENLILKAINMIKRKYLK